MGEAGFEVVVGSAAPVAVGGGEEGVAEAGGAGGVGEHDDVACLGEDGRVPPGGPGVCPGGVGAAVDEEGDGIGFVWGEGGGPHDPGVDRVVAGAGEGDFRDLGGGEAEGGAVRGEERLGGGDGVEEGEDAVVGEGCFIDEEAPFGWGGAEGVE